MSAKQNKLNNTSLRGEAKKSTHRPRKPKFPKININEEIKVDIQRKVQQFIESDENSLTMPATLTKDQRAYTHRYVQKLGLISRSRGKKENRCLTIQKPKGRAQIGDNSGSLLQDECVDLIFDLLERQENTRIPLNGILPASEKLIDSNDKNQSSLAVKHLTKKHIPPSALPPTWINQERRKLPIWSMRDKILDMIVLKQVVILSGETGSGKSTQLPQYILEDANMRRVPCRIICTQPRRIAAISISERVACERGEKLGTTVGYQIRLENKFQRETNLIYATSGCFLRSLMGNSSQTFEGVTHVIIDEIHERDKNTDFILIALREELKKNKKLKIVLMSATMNINLLSDYFDGSRVIEVPGKCYETRCFFLEDILFYINYETAKMRAILESMQEPNRTPKKALNFANSPLNHLDPETKNFVDDLIQSCCNESQEDVTEHFEQLFYLFEGEGVPVDIQNTKTGRTPLMAASMRNNFKYINLLLKKGAQTEITDHEGKTALDYARQYGADTDCLLCLNSASMANESLPVTADKQSKLLSAYLQTLNSECDEVDHDLLISLLLTIHSADYQGSVLIFLPGYNDMMIQKEMIERELKRDTYRLFLIHGSMNTTDQRMAFKQTKVRKIILATNIAETSITFPDVAYVIDTGLVKVHVYNSTTGSSYLQSMDISQACAKQRAGRAGRTQSGICYCLYTSAKYASMREYAVPEFLRVPLMEICLYTKVISKDVAIADYLSKAIEAPSIVNVTNAIRKLKMIGALDESENLTILGKRLVDIPLDVPFGKCLLYSVLLSCVNPVVTIVAYYSVKDPFLLPSDRMDRGRVSSMRKELCENAVSDHLGIIRLFQKWRRSRQLRIESRFLADYNLSKQSLEMMLAIQNQIFEYVKRAFLHPGTPISVLNRNSNDWNMIRACLTSGLYPNIACIDRTDGKIRTRFEKSTAFHATSILSDSNNKNERKSYENLPTDWIVFTENSRMGNKAFIRYNTMVTPLNIALFCGGLELGKLTSDTGQSEEENEEMLDSVQDNNESKIFAIDEWIQFNIPIREFYALNQFKEILLESFINLLHHGRCWYSEKYSFFLNTLKRILTTDSYEKFGVINEPFDDSYLPQRYDTLTNIEHFQIDRV